MGLCNAKNHAKFQVDRLKARCLPTCGKSYNFVACMFTFADLISRFAR